MPEEKKAPVPVAEKASYFLIVMNDADPPQLTRCDDAAAFSLAVQKSVLGAKEQIYAFAFKGQRIPIAPPQPICVIEIDGQTMKIGSDSPQYNEAGKIVPLTRSDDE